MNVKVEHMNGELFKSIQQKSGGKKSDKAHVGHNKGFVCVCRKFY